MPAAQKKKAPEKKPETEEVALKKAPALTMPRFGLAEEARNIWYATVPKETLPDQVMDEGFWSNVARLMQPGDEIIVISEHYAWRRDLQVKACGAIWAQVDMLTHYDLAGNRTTEHKVASKYKIEFAGAHHKWRVLREGEPLKDGFASEKLAAQWAANHEAAVNR